MYILEKCVLYIISTSFPVVGHPLLKNYSVSFSAHDLPEARDMESATCSNGERTRTTLDNSDTRQKCMLKE